jgi:hypothetical protein
MGNTISNTRRSIPQAQSPKADQAAPKKQAKTQGPPASTPDQFEAPKGGMPRPLSADEAARQREAARAKTTVEFGSGWTQRLAGKIKPGEPLTLVYDPNRAQQRSTHNGYPSWGVEAFVKFSPGGEVVRAPAMTFENRLGTPTSNPLATPVTVNVPKGTTEVQVWFRNWSMNNGSPSQSWDSNFGSNYRFQVQQ